MSEQIPDPVAMLDQLLRSMADLAKAVRGYHQSLVNTGFTSDEAMVLAIVWQNAIMAVGASQ